MSFLSSLKNLTSKASSEIADQFNRVKNKDLMEAVVASCTYVAYADGRISQEEKTKMIGFLQHSELLRMYSTESVIETFGKFSRKFEFAQEIGESEVMNALGKLSNVNEKEMVVRACVIIANSDGNFDQSEKNAVNKICYKLGLNASQFV